MAYAQMVRPRAVFAVGTADVSPLPEPDVSVALDGDSLADGVEELRRSFAEGAFDPEAEDFEAEVVQEDEEGEGGMDHGHDHGHDHGEEEEQEDQESESEDEDDEPEEKEIGEDQLENFMSMIEMTEGMPESGDGLIMEWVPAPYGPLFPGLPGGLSLTFTLDGDTVAETEVKTGIEGHSPRRDFVWTNRKPGRTRREARSARADLLPAADSTEYRECGRDGDRLRGSYVEGRRP